MNIEKISKCTFIGSGVYILFCIPAIFIAEYYNIRQAPFHITQFLADILCFISCIVYLWETSKNKFTWTKALAVFGLILLTLWLSFFIFVLCTLDFGGID